jgi:glycerol-3-phosphate O-acyltransferase/dihydroxyacetone phosphate acyltransferase
MYRLARSLLRVALMGFFRRVTIQGRERIPGSGPVLFVSNHANAFVDPLLILTGVRRRVTLTAKRALARNPLLAPVIRALGVILLERRSDVAQEEGDAAHNEAAMAACVRVLRRGGALYLFPEGISHSDPGMRRWRTGGARILLDALEGDDAPDVTIVPLGLHYDRKSAWRSTAVALVGDPVSARAWRTAHPEAGARDLTAAMERWVREVTANFDTEGERALVTAVAGLLAHAGSRPAPLDQPAEVDHAERVSWIHRLRRGARWLGGSDPAKLDELQDRVERFQRRLRALGITVNELGLPLHWGRAALFVVREMEVLVVGLPLALWGWLNHLPALEVTRAAVRRLSIDEDHWASNAVFVSIPVFLLWYAVLAALAVLLLPGLWSVVYLASLPLAGAVALLYRDRAGSAGARVRTFITFVRHPERQARLQAELRELTDDILALESTIPEPE